MKKIIISFFVVVLFFGMTGIAMAYSIRDDATGGNCTSIGIWDSATKTCTLTTDVNETIQIDSNYITLDGNGHAITGTCTGSGAYPNLCYDFYTGWESYGVYLPWKTSVTIKNLNIKNFSYGIYLLFSSNNTLTGNTVSNGNYMGIYGIYLAGSNDNILTGNTVSNTTQGISNTGSNNTLTSNTTFSNDYGIVLSYSTILIGNTASGNNLYGFVFYWGSSDSTILTGNTACDNGRDDFYCLGCYTFLTESDNRCDKLYDCPINCRPCGIADTTPPTIDGLTKLINQFLISGAVDNIGIANSLISKLTNALAAKNSGNVQAANNMLNAFINQVQAQSGQHISADAAAILINAATYIINN